jgi:LysR family hca operon transcriptional activator
MPRALAVLRAELPDLEVRVLSMYSPQLAEELRRGKLDVGFLRQEPVEDLEFQTVAQEPLVVLLPSDHPLAKRKALHPRDLVGETYIGVSSVPHVLREVIAVYLRRCRVTLTPAHLIDNVSIGISLVASTRGVTLLPAYAESVLPWSVVSRPLEGESPTIDLTVGYRRDNASPILRTFLSRLDALRAAARSTSRHAAPRREN